MLLKNLKLILDNDYVAENLYFILFEFVLDKFDYLIYNIKVKRLICVRRVWKHL